jgi:hypothetical protein
MYNYLSNRLNIPWDEILLQKPMVTQPVKKFPAFYGIPKLIAVLTDALHKNRILLTLSQFTPSHPISLRSISIVPFHLRLDVPSVSFSIQVFLLTFVRISHLPHTHTMLHPVYPPRLYHRNSTGWSVQTLMPLIIQFSPVISFTSDPNIFFSNLFPKHMIYTELNTNNIFYTSSLRGVTLMVISFITLRIYY